MRRGSRQVPGQLRGAGHPGSFEVEADESFTMLRRAARVGSEVCELGVSAVPVDAGPAPAAALGVHGARAPAGDDPGDDHGADHRGAHGDSGSFVCGAQLPALPARAARAARPARPAPRAARATLPRTVPAPSTAPPVFAEQLQTLQAVGRRASLLS